MTSQLTKRALEESFKRQLSTKPFSKITIADIAQDCGISRMTFYYHFKDIYDLMEWSLEEDAKHAIDGCKTVSTWQEGYLGVLNELAQNRQFINAIYREVSHERVERFLMPATRELIFGVVNDDPLCDRVPERERTFIADFYAHALAGVTLEWIGNGMAEKPEHLQRRVGIIMEGAVSTALSRFTSL